MKLTCADVREFAAGFVLDALEPDEMRAVREHLANCEEAHDEYRQLGGVVPYLAETVEPVEPPPALKQRLLAAAAAERQASREPYPGMAARAPRAAPESRAWDPPAERAASAPSQRRGPAPFVWLAGMAAALVIAVLGGTAWLLQSELQAARQYEEGVAAVLEVATAGGSQLAVLRGEDAAGPQGLAAVAADGRIAVVVRDLPATSGEEVYEAWVIAGDAAPVPVGGFRVGRDGTGTLVSAAQAPPEGVVIAITREPAPGATSPTLPIVVSGAGTAPPS
ncbi:MAG: anti-sigma factor [Chloroflexota bacterium]|nr:anti-sigma factor [Chloroflexota bacterium]